MVRRLMKVVWFGAMLCLLPTFATAQGRADVRKQLEASMLLKGSIDIAVDGSVEQVSLEHEEIIPEAVAAFVRDAAMVWKFEPIMQEERPVKARSPMSVRVVANTLENGDYQIRIRNASFEHYDPDDRSTIRYAKQRPPRYPTNAFVAGVAGDVYALVRVGRDGRALEAVTEQVNLQVVASERDMRKWRDVLAHATEKAIRWWRFEIPSEGEAAGRPYWVVTVPVSFRLSNPGRSRIDRYGTWEAYVPGPVALVPWRDGNRSSAGSPDALADGGVYMDGAPRGPRLLTSLDNS